MIIVDTALSQLEADKTPINVGLVGAGAMAQGIALQILRYSKGLRLCAISNRHIERAAKLYSQSGVNPVYPPDQVRFDRAMQLRQPSVVDDPTLLCNSPLIDVIVEVTGAVEFSAAVVLDAIDNGKHVVMMNAELDSTVGPILKRYADRRGVVLTNVDGDQPGVIMNLYRFVQGIGVKPLMCGNIKGLQDPYRTPTTQESFARRWKQNAPMVTSFADGTKISFEQALVANATGMRVAKRGMFGPVVTAGEHVDNAASWYPIDLLEHDTGIVDYVVGASPGPGVFVLGTHDDPLQQHYLELYKLGEGPVYTFYTPYHLCHFEVPATIARAVLFNDAAIAPAFGPCVDVIATAKRDLKCGEILDGIGHYMTYGQCENAGTVAQEKLLPMGLAEGCVLKKDLPRDRCLSLDDVEVPEGRLIDKLRNEQNRTFFD
ncbi:MAG: NAD(P)H-dependent oxidoreductase [Granulosicoccus sp.]